MGFKEILVALDFSEGNEAVLNVAAELAGPLGAHLELVHVYNVAKGPRIKAGIYYAGKINRSINDETVARLETAVGERVAALQERGVDAGGRVVRGMPADQILDTADELGADLILIGRRSIGSLRRSILGSVSKRILARARVPVLCLNPGVASIGEPAPPPDEDGTTEDELTE